jgi:pimeloyl-ACP methyl ester carboxylesterase
MTRQSITSTDGTTIAYQRSGDGTPLVLVHGTAGDHRRWAPVLPAFEQQFTVCAVDRRGRGGSGDTGRVRRGTGVRRHRRGRELPG